MTNEELCLQIQEGHDELVPVLWSQCYDFISMTAGKYAERFPQLDNSIKEDCIQEAFFSFLNAVRLYKSEQASFIHYLNYHLMNAFKTVCCGGTSQKKMLDPLNNAKSLDIQLGEEDERFTLADLVADKEKGEQTEYVTSPELKAIEEADYWKSVNKHLHHAFDHSSDKVGSRIYHYILDNDCSFRDAILSLYGEDVFQDEKLMRKLRASKEKTRRNLISYWNTKKGKREREKLALDDDIIFNGYRSYGLKRYIESGYSSQVEEIAIRRIENEDKNSG